MYICAPSVSVIRITGVNTARCYKPQGHAIKLGVWTVNHGVTLQTTGSCYKPRLGIPHVTFRLRLNNDTLQYNSMVGASIRTRITRQNTCHHGDGIDYMYIHCQPRLTGSHATILRQNRALTLTLLLDHRSWKHDP